MGGIDVKKGDYLANVFLSVSLQQDDCVVTVNVPEVDADGCWVYKKPEDDKGWGELDQTERATATAADYVLQQKAVDVPMSKIADRVLQEAILTPISSIKPKENKFDEYDQFGDSVEE